MAFHGTFLSEFLFTKVTLKRLFSSVTFHMFFPIFFLDEFLFTQFTLVRFFSTVNFEMSIQTSTSSESNITDITFEWLVIHLLNCSFFNVLRNVELKLLASVLLDFVLQKSRNLSSHPNLAHQFFKRTYTVQSEKSVLSDIFNSVQFSRLYNETKINFLYGTES